MGSSHAHQLQLPQDARSLAPEPGEELLEVSSVDLETAAHDGGLVFGDPAKRIAGSLGILIVHSNQMSELVRPDATWHVLRALVPVVGVPPAGAAPDRTVLALAER